MWFDSWSKINLTITMPGKLVSRMSERGCHTLNETDTIKKASQELSEKKIGCMPVLDKNKSVIGIISERDISQIIYKESGYHFLKQQYQDLLM